MAICGYGSTCRKNVTPLIVETWQVFHSNTLMKYKHLEETISIDPSVWTQEAINIEESILGGACGDPSLAYPALLED